jgi:two-component system, OmpR family, response regulator
MRPIAAHPDADPHARSAVVVDSDPARAAFLRTHLERQGFAVHDAADGHDGLDRVHRAAPDLATVHVDLPGIDGLETVRRLRRFFEGFIVLISDDDSESAVIEGLRCGADDFLVDPISPYVFRARVDALLRRSARMHAAAPAPQADLSWVEHGPLQLHPASRRVRLSGEECDLTRSEFDLLRTLLASKNQVFSKSTLAQILREANGLHAAHITAHDRHAVEVHIMNLRRKLGDDPRAPLWIETVRGLGYRLAAPAGASAGMAADLGAVPADLGALEPLLLERAG